MNPTGSAWGAARYSSRHFVPRARPLGSGLRPVRATSWQLNSMSEYTQIPLVAFKAQRAVLAVRASHSAPLTQLSYGVAPGHPWPPRHLCILHIALKTDCTFSICRGWSLSHIPVLRDIRTSCPAKPLLQDKEPLAHRGRAWYTKGRYWATRLPGDPCPSQLCLRRRSGSRRSRSAARPGHLPPRARTVTATGCLRRMFRPALRRGCHI